MRSTVRWSEGKGYEATTEKGHVVAMGVSPEMGGTGNGPSPMELILAGAGGCTCVDVVFILKRGRYDVRDCRVEVQAERAETDPKVFTKIHFHYVVAGKDLPPDRVERAIKLSEEKYCSASAMLGKTATITHDWEVVLT
ncbi:MAG: OsmC family protein [Myxococcales bacterium]